MSAANKHGLGRGLGALLGDMDLDLDLNSSDKGAIKSVKLNQIVAGRYQPRQQFDEEAINALAKSVKEKGILQPMLVRIQYFYY